MSAYVAFILFLACVLTACTVQEEYRDGELVGRSIGIGIGLLPDCSDGPAVFRTEAFGLGVARGQASLGYVSSDLICVPPDDCRAIFYVERAEEVAAIRALIGDLEAVCVAPQG